MKKKIFPVNYACIPCNNAIFIVCGKCGEKLTWGMWTVTGGETKPKLKCPNHGFINAPVCDCGVIMTPFRGGTSEDFK